MRFLSILAASAALSCGIGAALAADQESDRTQQDTARAAGMRAYVDPETGKLSATPVTAEQQV